MRIRSQALSAGALALTSAVAIGAASASQLPPPKFARSVDIGLVSGVVVVKPAGGSPFRLGASDRSIPVGSEIDSSHGEVDLRSSRAPGSSSVAASTTKPIQDAQFRGGLFKVLQRRSQRGLTVLDLVTTRQMRLACALRSAAARANRGGPRRVLQTLHARDSGGRFRTRGRYSAGTVRGTTWSTIDRCDGTLTVVTRGTVSVYDFGLRKTISVHAGHGGRGGRRSRGTSYLAKAVAR